MDQQGERVEGSEPAAASEQESWQQYQQRMLQEAGGAFSAIATGDPVQGIGERSVGCRARIGGQERWLRVVSEPTEWAHGDLWEGNLAANVIRGVAKPDVLDVREWDVDGRRVRAEVMTLVTDSVCSPTMVLRRDLDLPPEWWSVLRRSLDALASTPTQRVTLDRDTAAQRVLAFFGRHIELSEDRWTVCHGDLHWANLTAPRFHLLDWEAWGSGPAGYDAALLYCASLLQPQVARKAHEIFADQLDSPQGLHAQLAAAAKLLRMVEYGHHPDIAAPLHRHAGRILQRLLHG